MIRTTSNSLGLFTQLTRLKLRELFSACWPRSFAGTLVLAAAGWHMAALAQPVILNVSPADRSIFVPYTNGLSFDVTSDAGVKSTAVTLNLNGVDQTPGLGLTGNSNSWHGTFSNLQSNVAYIAIISATDTTNGQAQTTIYFDTFSGNDLIIQAEDYNYAGGQFIDNPGNNGYAGLIAVEEVDIHITTADHNSYRPDDRLYIEVQGNGDTPLPGQSPNWDIGYYSGEWMNYTRTFASGAYYLYGRMSTGDATAQRAQADRILSGATTANQVIAPMGFYIVRAGDWARYEFYPLRDAGNNSVITRLNGANTFRLTGDPGGGEINNNYFMLVPAPGVGTLRPYASLSSVAAAQQALPDTAITVRLTDRDTQVQTNSIHLLLDNVDHTSGSTIGAADGGATVSYTPASPFVPNSTHTIKITFQDNTSTSVTNTWQFSVANLAVLPASLATPLGSGFNPGFNIHVVRAPSSADQSLFPPTVDRAEAQLAGQIIDPGTGQPFDNTAGGPNGDGLYTETNQINYARVGPSLSAQGIFTNDSYFPYMDDGSTRFSALEAVAWVELPQAGSYTFGFRMAEGYSLSTGTTFSNTNIPLGTFITTLGSSEAVCNFLISQPGIYPFRLVWLGTTGGTDLEWYSFTNINNTATRVLLNTPGGLTPYQGVLAPVSLRATRVNHDIILSFSSMTNRMYRVQSSTNFTAWTNLGDLPGTGNTLNQTNANATLSSTHQYYRVQTMP